MLTKEPHLEVMSVFGNDKKIDIIYVVPLVKLS
jgi:hypothetical protein